MRKYQFIFTNCLILFSLAVVGFSQTPEPTPPDNDINITTEEIKLNISAVTNSGQTALGLTVDDVVISENGRLHQATSVRQIPANVLFVLDVGNEISYAKRNKITAKTARNLVNALDAEDSIAVIQYGDKVETLSDWTKDKSALNKILGDNKLGLGKHSRFNLAVTTAVDFFAERPLENRHLILITDGIDSQNDAEARDLLIKRLLSSDINVHVISYTRLQQQSIKGLKTVNVGGIKRQPQAPGIGPPEGLPPVGGSVSINLDREMIRHRKKQLGDIVASEEFLTTLAENTNGEIFLPETSDEMTDKMGNLAKYIDSQYVVTYTPNNPLEDAADGEIRNIQVTSRKSGVYIQSSRKYVVLKEK
jgi:VWFA-related protein